MLRIYGRIHRAPTLHEDLQAITDRYPVPSSSPPGFPLDRAPRRVYISAKYEDAGLFFYNRNYRLVLLHRIATDAVYFIRQATYKIAPCATSFLPYPK